jgi:hypothetical protein
MLLAVGAAAALLAALVPHEVGRFAAIPVGLALIWLGYSLWSNPGTVTAAATEPSSTRVQSSTGRVCVGEECY